MDMGDLSEDTLNEVQPSPADDQPVTLEDLEAMIQTARKAHEALASMAEALGVLANRFLTASTELRRTLAEHRMTADAMHWRPTGEEEPDIATFGGEILSGEFADLPIRVCPRAFHAVDHPVHLDSYMNGDLARCPGWPLPVATPVRHCPLMFQEEEHTPHPDADLSGSLVQCPGWPLPSIADFPVRWCPDMHSETDHPGHDWDWTPQPMAATGLAIQSRCPGWPLPSIFDLAPDCETGDDRTCTLSCPLHG